MEIDCVVEGVETIAELNALRELGCHLIQGYCYAPPMSQNDIPAFLAKMNELAKSQIVLSA